MADTCEQKKLCKNGTKKARPYRWPYLLLHTDIYIITQFLKLRRTIYPFFNKLNDSVNMSYKIVDGKVYFLSSYYSSIKSLIL